MKKNCIIIVGPTAIGKTALSLQLAQHFSTEIISCDSRQCFKELDIAVAKPTAKELSLIKHHFISSHSIQEEMNASLFEGYALKKIKELFATKDLAVMVGGTGLYAKAFCEGMDEVPAINPSIRQIIVTNFNNNGIEWLQEQVKKKDHQFFIKGELYNPQRMMRALEVKMSTGRSIIDYQTKQKKQRDFNIIKIGLELPRQVLIERINHRVDKMLEAGLQDEVKNLWPYQHLNALQTVGYRELFMYLEKEISLEQAVEQIKVNTRQYAKRQMTWFKKDETIQWCQPDFEEIMGQIKNALL
jgi:tRNA dimethylallyltransferase